MTSAIIHFLIFYIISGYKYSLLSGIRYFLSYFILITFVKFLLYYFAGLSIILFL